MSDLFTTKDYKPGVVAYGKVQTPEEVEHPSHYNSGKIEVIDYIEDQDLNFNLGNVVKYVSRAGKKDASKTIVDLKKAKFYIEREIKRLEAKV